ncbi:hypothetical protein X770_09670 [Mesorhizobium sp. LSJC269B00]|nr:hypothetical protein X770_09670 [Mesorhizobium sp. LSJC269B00]
MCLPHLTRRCHSFEAVFDTTGVLLVLRRAPFFLFQGALADGGGRPDRDLPRHELNIEAQQGSLIGRLVL